MDSKQVKNFDFPCAHAVTKYTVYSELLRVVGHQEALRTIDRRFFVQVLTKVSLPPQGFECREFSHFQ